MKDVVKQIEILTEYVKAYYDCDRTNGEDLMHLLQKITGTLFFLEHNRSKFHALYESKVFELVGKGNSVARAVNEANNEYPEMYQLRRVMDGGYRIVDAIRTNISYLKSEKQSVNNQL
jgi:hypothetical protein